MPTKHADTFAARLHALRTAAGLSLTELAARAGLSYQSLSYLERGQREPSLATAQKIAQALGRGLEVWNQRGE